MSTLQELEEQMRSIQADLRTLADIQDPSDDDVIVQDTLIQEHATLEKKVEPLRKRMAEIGRIRELAAEPDKREEPRTAPTMFVRSNRDPLEDLDRVRANLVSADDLRARAMNLIEEDSKRQRWEFPDNRAEAANVRAQSPQIARHILLVGSQEYREAFRSYMDTGDDTRFRDIRLANASGGYLLPYVLDPTIVLTNSSSANPFRRVSRVVQTTSNAWQGVNSAGVNAALVAEAATAADAAPSDFAQIQVVPKKFTAWVLGTYEALDDTDFGTQLPGLLADAKDRIESSYFATGSGTLAPQGIASAMVAGNHIAISATGTAFGTTANIPDLYALQGGLPPRFRKAPGAAFMGNILFLNKVRALDQYGGGAFWTNLTTDTPSSLLGQPVYEASDFQSSITTGTSAASGTASITLIFGDFGSGFIIADRVGVSMLYDPLIKGTGSAAQLPAGEAGWYMFWRTSSQLSTTAAFRYLSVS